MFGVNGKRMIPYRRTVNQKITAPVPVNSGLQLDTFLMQAFHLTKPFNGVPSNIMLIDQSVMWITHQH